MTSLIVFIGALVALVVAGYLINLSRKRGDIQTLREKVKRDDELTKDDRQIIVTSKPKDFSVTLLMEPNSNPFPNEIPENLEEIDLIHEKNRLRVGYIFLSGKKFSNTHVQKDFQDLTGKQLLTLKYSLKVVLDNIDGFLTDKRETEKLLKELSDGPEEKEGH